MFCGLPISFILTVSMGKLSVWINCFHDHKRKQRVAISQFLYSSIMRDLKFMRKNTNFYLFPRSLEQILLILFTSLNIPHVNIFYLKPSLSNIRYRILMKNVDYIKRKLNQKSQVSNQIKSLRGFEVNSSKRHGKPVRVNTDRVVWKGYTF